MMEQADIEIMLDFLAEATTLSCQEALPEKRLIPTGQERPEPCRSGWQRTDEVEWRKQERPGDDGQQRLKHQEALPQDEGRKAATTGDLVLRAGRRFLGAPYGAKTLEAPGPEALVVNLRVFDCFTLVENCCALALLARQIIMNSRTEDQRQRPGTNEDAIKNKGPRPEIATASPRQGDPPTPAAISSPERSDGGDFVPPPDLSPGAIAAAFAALLRTLRYRNGVIAGYPSRLHYFSDWVEDNEQLGLLVDITARLRGRPSPKVIDFMTKHRELYPSLGNDAAFGEIREIERRLSASPRHILPREEIAVWEDRIALGDILAVATHEEGLDVTHAGLAIRRAGRLHLLHASSEAGRVIVSPETLAAYLQGRENRAGVIVARLSSTCDSMLTQF